MKRKKIVALALALLLALAACGQSEQDKIYDELTKTRSASESRPESEVSVPSDVTTTDDENELVITAWTRLRQPISTLDALAQEFMDAHPGVNVRVEYEVENVMTEPNINQRREAYNTRLRAEMGSGEADYILYAPSGTLNPYELSHSGVLLDMRPYWENDPNINKEDYFAPVLDAFAIDGKMTVIPFAFCFDGVYLNRSVMDSLQVDTDSFTTVDYKTVMDWYDQALAFTPDLQLIFGALGKDVFFNDERAAYINAEDRTASFDSPEFLEYLNRTNGITDNEPDLTELECYQGEYPDVVNEMLRSRATGEELALNKAIQRAYKYGEKGRDSLVCVTSMVMSSLVHYQQPLEYLAGPYPLESTNGQIALTSIDDFAVPSSIQNPDLAWEFISFCLQERESMVMEDGSLYTDFIPLNKHNFAKQIEVAVETLNNTYAQSGEEAEAAEVNGALVTEKLDAILSGTLVNGKVFSVDMAEFLEEFYINGLTTAEQCAEKIQGRAYIWLNE